MTTPFLFVSSLNYNIFSIYELRYRREDFEFSMNFYDVMGSFIVINN